MTELLKKNDFYTPAFKKFIAPRIMADILDWIGKNYSIARESSSEPGPYNIDRVPYVRDLLKLITDPSVEEIYIEKGSQMGITEMALAAIAYLICEDPKNILYMLPTELMAKKISAQRIAPMISANPLVHELVKSKEKVSHTDNVLTKTFPGGLWTLVHSHSSSAIKSLPFQIAFLDEIEEYEDIQGDIIGLVRGRFQAQPYKKIIGFSTPTDKTGRTHVLVNDTLIHCIFVPCPHCGVYDYFRFEDFIWEKGRPETVKWICPSCKEGVQEHLKQSMMLKGELRPSKANCENPDAMRGKVVGAWLPSFYAPYGLLSWEEIANRWEEVERTGSEEKRKAFFNHLLGWGYEAKVGELPDWERIYKRREQFDRNILLEGYTLLTCGVDVQKNYLALEIVAWKGDESHQSQSVDYREIPGETEDPNNQCWEKLAELLDEEFPTESGQFTKINSMAVDSGYNTSTVYGWIKKYKHTGRVFAIKGQDSDVPIGGAKDLELKTGNKGRLKTRVQIIGVNLLKAELYSWLKAEAPEEGEHLPAGWCRFPEYDESYFQMLISEKQVEKIIKSSGRKKLVWEKLTSHTRNEALDCRVYNRAAYYLLGFEQFTAKAWQIWNKKFTNIAQKYVKVVHE